MKYKLIKTDLFLNGKLIPEGRTIELTEKEVSSLSECLEELKEVQSEQIDETNSQVISNSEKTETKTKRGKQ